MDRLFTRSMPDWSDHASVAEFAAAGAEVLGDDPAAASVTAERIWDRTPGTESAIQMANQRSATRKSKSADSHDATPTTAREINRLSTQLSPD